ncbi:MAG: amino acid ABC transporter substrate-binding protein [Solirubrobacterales bacterium]|nr:amino acid ABC transporter substrate-binding protein [Solirubrobacterales bacterium]MBV9801488.1 amino acid ABC transporter substrate-binding protein [Solirubrobacterales bacterium]
MRAVRRRIASGLVAKAAASALVLSAGVLSGCGVLTTSPAAGTFKPRNRGVLTVVTSDVPEPGFWVGTIAHPTGGFEYELARDLAVRFGLKSVHIRIEQFNRVVDGKLGDADLALDLITPTSQREQNLDFSAAYLTDPPAVVVRSGTDMRDLATAQGVRWGAITSTTFVGDIRSLVDPNSPVRIYDQQADMLAALADGRIDAVLMDLPLAVAMADRSNGKLTVVAQLPVAEDIAAALPKGSGNRQAVDSAMRAFTATGIIDQLLKKWVGPAAANADKAIPLLHTTRR